MLTVVMLKNLSSGGSVPDRLLHDLHRVGALHLEAIRLAAAVGAKRRSLVELHLDVVVAGLGVVGDPVQRRSTADEVEPIVAEREQDHVTDHVTGRCARHEVLGLPDLEAVEAVDREVREQLSGVGALHREVGHVERLVEEDAGLLPGLVARPASW